MSSWLWSNLESWRRVLRVRQQSGRSRQIAASSAGQGPSNGSVKDHRTLCWWNVFRCTQSTEVNRVFELPFRRSSQIWVSGEIILHTFSSSFFPRWWWSFLSAEAERTALLAMTNAASHRRASFLRQKTSPTPSHWHAWRASELASSSWEWWVNLFDKRSFPIWWQSWTVCMYLMTWSETRPTWTRALLTTPFTKWR